MGQVYKVEHLRIGKVAALKMVHSALAGNQEVRRRFLREARAVSRLTHPNTVQVFDFGEFNGVLYLIMEYIHGTDLSTVLRRDRRMDAVRAASIIVQVCDALSEAHEKGVIHRDIKPENLLLKRHRDGSDFVKVVDFGLARLQGEVEPNITSQGSVLGTPYYMAPEQARGEDPDERTDIYAVGAVLYQMLTGEPPFVAPSPLVVLTKCLSEEVTPPTRRVEGLALPAGLEDVVVKALAKDRADRFQSADEFAQALFDRVPNLTMTSLPGHGSAAIPIRRDSDFSSELSGVVARLSREDLDRFEKRLKIRRGIQIAILPLLLLLGVAAGGWWYLNWRARSPLRAVTCEQEPNNTTIQANLIANGKAVEGTIGKRISETEPDVDAYAFDLPEGRWRVDLLLWPQRNMDLSLGLYMREGNDARELALSQRTGDSGPEALTSWLLDGGQYYAVVSQVVGPKGPLEGVSDKYRLLVRWTKAGFCDESEPNDTMESAQSMRCGWPAVISGSLAGPDDVDCFEMTSPGKVVSASLQGAKGGVVQCLSWQPSARIGQDPVRDLLAMAMSRVSRDCSLQAEAGGKIFVCVRGPKSSGDPVPVTPESLVRPYRVKLSVSDPTPHRPHTSGSVRPSRQGHPGSSRRIQGK